MAEDTRIKKTVDETRQDRSAPDVMRTAADEHTATVEERRRMFRDFKNEILPTPPSVNGWRFTWLSTQNQYDPIFKRLRMGYELVKTSMLPGYENFRVNSGAYEDCIQVNEMILARIPEELYQDIMAENHYYAPADEEQRLKANAVLSDEDSAGRQLGSIEGDGFKSLRDDDTRRRPAPKFS